MTEFDQIQEEEAERAQREFYESLEGNIADLRIEVYSQAKLLKELGMIPEFINRVLKLEDLQRAWDVWAEEDTDEDES